MEQSGIVFVRLPGSSLRLFVGASLCLGLLLNATGAEPATNPAPFLVQSWTTAEGLPQNSVQAIAQTTDGYLWTGTKGGLSRFDGVRFKNYGLADGLKSLHVRALANDGQGGLWIATLGGGLSHWRDGVIRTLTTKDGLLHDDVYALASAEPGGVWLGTARGLQYWGADGFTRIGEAEGVNGPIASLAVSPTDGLWVSVEAVGLFRRHDGRCERIKLPTSKSSHPSSLLVDADGEVWAGLGNGMVLRRREGAWIEHNESHGVPFSYVHCMAQGVAGEVWAGSHEQGLLVFRGGRFHAVPGTDPSIRAVMVSRDGVVWVGTLSGGLNRLTPSRAMAYPVGSATARGEVNGLAEHPPAHFWAATWAGGVHQGPLEKLELVTGVSALTRDPYLRASLRTSNGNLYFIGPTQVVRRDAGTGSFDFTPLAGANLNSLCEDADGSIFLGGRDGVLRRMTAE